MTAGKVTLVLALVLGSAALRAQSPPPDPHAAMAGSLEQQRAAVAAMEESLARQRSSTDAAAGQDRFFILAPPSRLGANFPAPAPVVTGDCPPLPQAEIDSLVTKAAQQQGLDEAVLRSVIRQESGFRPCAVSSKGAMGLMQLMPATAGDLGVRNPFDPEDNVEAGARFLKTLLQRYGGDLSLALGAYNAGPAKVDAAGGTPNIPETQDYITKIMAALPFILQGAARPRRRQATMLQPAGAATA